ncbi:unnamed protein product [Miscanthus lutarioriparius]|uniref:F-box domain-containing protein n=1 Tax=Miscanthus lutarioriparius TaxID=422564 RepID=A0A811SC33_9POAL|nr:unnamed protein product [Miscanthus lutarioriparius]
MAETTTPEHEQEGDDDRLSTLPDDILLLILNKLDLIRDAARTTVLSKRWRHLLGLRSEIVLDVLNFDATHQDDDDLEYTMDDLLRTNASVVEATEILLRQHRRQHTTIQLLDITFYLRDESIGIVRAVDRAMADHRILAAKFTVIPDVPDVYCEDDDVLLAYGRRFMTFFDAYPRAFTGLKDLNLHALRLGESDIANVLSACEKLEYSSLVNCDAGIGDDQLSVLQIEHSRLVELVVIFCGFGTVELKWLPRLTRLTCRNWMPSQDQYPLSIGYVPQLLVLTLSNACTAQHKTIKLTEFLGNTAVAELDLNFLCEKMSYHICYSDEENQTGENTRENFDRAADLLKWETRHDFKHYNMKKLTIKGFQVEAKFTRYIRRVMEAAMNLEVVSLRESHPCLRCEFLPSTVYPRTHKEINLIKKQISAWRSSPIQIEIV